MNKTFLDIAKTRDSYDSCKVVRFRYVDELMLPLALFEDGMRTMWGNLKRSLGGVSMISQRVGERERRKGEAKGEAKVGYMMYVVRCTNLSPPLIYHDSM